MMNNISNISFINKLVAAALVSGVAITAFALISDGDISVSYTHLTLPTKA